MALDLLSFMDDEDNPTHRTVLIEDGILEGYMEDQLNARLMGIAPADNGRRESFANLLMPRTTNTIMLAGHRPPAELIASVGDGRYAMNFGGGQVDITGGNFMFSMAEAWMIDGLTVGGTGSMPRRDRSAATR